jgi:hypothetical protein
MNTAREIRKLMATMDILRISAEQFQEIEFRKAEYHLVRAMQEIQQAIDSLSPTYIIE